MLLSASDVHIWQIDLRQPQSVVVQLADCLSSDEGDKASRFHFQEDRNRYVVAHGALRHVLSVYLNSRPKQVEFVAGRQGKPALMTSCNPRNLNFNLSHSGEIALLAVAVGINLGIDIERIRPDFAGIEVAERFFSEGEVRALLSTPQNLRTGAFFECWTRKEAYIKAHGEGLSADLRSFDVAFGSGVDARLMAVRPDSQELSRWSLYALPISDPSYKAALAAEGTGHRLNWWEWTPPVSSSS